MAITSKVVFSDELFDAPRFGHQKGSFPFCVFLIQLAVYLLNGKELDCACFAGIGAQV